MVVSFCSGKTLGVQDVKGGVLSSFWKALYGWCVRCGEARGLFLLYFQQKIQFFHRLPMELFCMLLAWITKQTNRIYSHWSERKNPSKNRFQDLGSPWISCAQGNAVTISQCIGVLYRSYYTAAELATHMEYYRFIGVDHFFVYYSPGGLGVQVSAIHFSTNTHFFPNVSPVSYYAITNATSTWRSSIWRSRHVSARLTLRQTLIRNIIITLSW